MAQQTGWGHKLVAVIFGLLSANAFVQVALEVLSDNTDPLTLTLLQVLVGVSGAAAAVGSWKLRQWAPVAAVSYGVITGTMLFLLPSLLDLGADARGGIWSGAVALLVASGLAAWWLRRRLRRLRVVRKLQGPSSLTGA